MKLAFLLLGALFLPLVLLADEVGQENEKVAEKVDAPSPDAWRAMKKLKEAKTFSFGGVGFAGSIPDREKQFFRILQSPRSHIVFKKLYDEGTNAAKAYAVAGLIQSDDGEKDKCIKKFKDSKLVINTMSGCESAALDSGLLYERLVDKKQYDEYINRVIKDLQNAEGAKLDADILKVALPIDWNEVKAKGVLVLTIDKDGGLHCFSKKLNKKEFADLLKVIAKENADQEIIIRGGNEVPFQEVIAIIDLCQDLGISNLSFATVRE